MRIYIVFLSLIFPFGLNAQFFKFSDGAYTMYADSALTKRVSDENFDHCWCEAVYAKDSTFLFLEGKKTQKGGYPVMRGKKWGAIDANGKEVNAFIFDGPFDARKSGHFLVLGNLKDSINRLHYQLGSTITRLDSTMKVDTMFYVMDDYKGSYLVSADKVKFGIVNADFKVLLPIKYESVYYKMINFRFNPSGLLPLENELDKCGVVNYLGKTVVSFNYDWMNDYVWNDNYIFVQSGKKKGFINSSNVMTVPMRYETLPMILGKRNQVADENYTWFVNEKFEALTPKYQALEKEGDVYFFKQNGKWGVMDLSMNIIVPNLYTSIEYGPRLKADATFKCYYAVKNGKYGLISLTNEIIVPFEYECLCGVSYFAPETYYIEFKKAGYLYRYDHTGKLIEKVAGEGKACLCEMTATE